MDLKYKYVACKNGYYTSHNGKRDLTGIIIHQTSGHKAGDIATLSGQTSRKVSSHWYVTKDGEIYHFVQDKDIAWHAGTCIKGWGNTNTIGIENEHINEEEWTTTQMGALAKLIIALRQNHGEELPCKSHAEVATPKGRKVDPQDFDWEDLHKRVEALKTQDINLVAA